MPHLAPLKWLFLTLIFWLVVLLSLSMTWWQTAPKITPFTSAFPKFSSPKWPWF